MSIIKRLIIIISPFLLWFLIHTTYVIIDGTSDNGASADVAVVLGNKVNPDGTLSERLARRLDCGLGLYNSKRIKKIIVSGGLGKEGFYEGDKMKEYLVANGVPDSVIIVDNKGDDTRATVLNTMKLKDSLGFESIIAVSQYYHLTRTKKLFKKQNIGRISSASPNYFEFRDVYSLIREFFAFYLQ